jgi:hypothetical protein
VRVFEDTVLRKIFGSKRCEYTWNWSKLHSEEIGNLCMRASQSRRMKWAGHIALRERGKVHSGFFCQETRRRETVLEDLCIGLSIILKWIEKMGKHGQD